MKSKIFSAVLALILSMMLATSPFTVYARYSEDDGDLTPEALAAALMVKLEEESQDESAEPVATPGALDGEGSAPELEEVPPDAAASTFGLELFAAGDGSVPAKFVADNHALLLRADGRLLVWGDNTYGQLGLGAGSPNKVYTPLENTFFTGMKVKDIAVCEDASFVLLSNGELYTFGKGLNGRLASGATSNISTPTLVSGSASLQFNKLYPGKEFVVASTNDNKLYAWGRNTKGQVGNGTKNDVLSPVKIMDTADVKTLTVGEDFVTLLKQNNSYLAWGNNELGQYGFNTSVNKTNSVVTAGSCTTPPANNGSFTACSVHNAQQVCTKATYTGCSGTWAVTESGYQGTKGATTVNIAIKDFSNPVSIVTGSGRVFAPISGLSTTGGFPGTNNGVTGNHTYKLISTATQSHAHNREWSKYNSSCVVGAPATKTSTKDYTHTWQYVLPNAFAYFDTSKITNLQLGNRFGVVCIDGMYYSWGDNSLKQQGTSGNANGYMVPSTTINNLVTTLNNSEGFSELVVAKDTNYVLSGSGNVYAWGNNVYGKAGTSSGSSYIDTPAAATGLNGKAIAKIVSGRNTTFFLSHTGDVYVVGDNLYGQSGLGDAYADESIVTAPQKIETFKFSDAMTPPDTPDEVNTPDEVEAGTVIEIHWPEVSSATGYELVRYVTQKNDGVLLFSSSPELVYNGDQSVCTDIALDTWDSVAYGLRAINFIGDKSPEATSNNITVLERTVVDPGDDGNNGNNNTGGNNGGGMSDEQFALILAALQSNGMSDAQFAQLLVGLQSNGADDDLIAAVVAASKKSSNVNVTAPTANNSDLLTTIAALAAKDGGGSIQIPATNVYTPETNVDAMVELVKYLADKDLGKGAAPEKMSDEVDTALKVATLQVLSTLGNQIVGNEPSYNRSQASGGAASRNINLYLIIGMIIAAIALVILRFWPEADEEEN